MPNTILYLSYYFEPDLGAGSFRNTALVRKVSELMKADDRILVLTTMPNRYANINQAALEHEIIGNLEIRRISVPRNSDSFLEQINSFLKYRKEVKKFTKGMKFDLVFASSSKLFTGYLAYRIASADKTKFYLDLRDIFAENLKELIPRFGIGHILSFFVKTFFERPCIKYATHLNLNSAGFINEFSYRDKETISFFPNGIDDFFIGHKQSATIQESPIVITYAGNIGEGQGLEKIIPPLAKKLGDKYLFKIIGSGSSVAKLQSEIDRLALKNVIIYPPVVRKELLKFYQNSHYLFLHLNDYKSFEKVIPSKVFEYAAFNIPILAGVAGFPAQFIQAEIKRNCFVFKPCDVDAIYTYLVTSHYDLAENTEFVEKFKRENITTELAKSILHYLK
ncbi:MAG: glycosyltransferase family 4 protein [Saprospiraceae bacterium]